MNSVYLFLIRKIAVLLILCFAIFSNAQSPYEISYKKDIPLLAGGILGDVLARVYVKNNVPDFTAFEIEQLNPQDINRFDRGTVDNNSSTSLDISDILLNSSYFLPAMVFLKKPLRRDFLTIGVISVEAYTWAVTLTVLTKGLVKRERPFLYNPNIPLADKISSKGRLSFFSGHTSGMATFSFFTAKVLNDYYPDSKWKPVIWTVAVALPATTAYLRVKGGKHFPTDVMAGFAVGGLVGYLIPHLHKKKKDAKKSNLSLNTHGNNIGLVWAW